MAYDEKIAARVRRAMARYKAVSEIKMFGGLCFTLRGNMCCGILKDDLVLRVAPGTASKYLNEPYVRPMDFTGRRMKNMLYVGYKGHASAPALRRWIKRSVDFVSTLPPKR